MFNYLEVFTLAKTVRTTDFTDCAGAGSDFDTATFVGLGTLAATGGAAALVGAAVLPGQVAVGLLTGGAFVGLGEVNRRTGSYLPFLDNEEARTRNQARADKKAAAREAKADEAVA